VRLSEAPPFETISYVWGDPNDRVEIKVNDRSLLITRNLLGALRQVSKGQRTKYLWTDGVCIDQLNIKEQGHQVALMAQIYEHAQRVLISLGPDDGFARARRVGKLLEQMKIKVTDQIEEYGSYNDIPTLDASRLEPFESLHWGSLAVMLDHKWFERAWIVQEIGLAREGTIFYGEEQFDWDQLIMVIAWVSQIGPNIANKTGIFYRNPQTLLRLWTSYRPESRTEYALRSAPSTFLEVLRHARTKYEASDLRDHLYAFLGHPTAEKEGILSFVEPDYEKAVEEIFLDFTLKWLERNKRSHIFAYAGISHGDNPTLNLPTWCPCWVGPCFQARSLADNMEPLNSTEADFNFKYLGSDKLEVQGFIFDEVDEVSSVLADDNIYHEYAGESSDSIEIVDFFYRVLKQGKNRAPITYGTLSSYFSVLIPTLRSAPVTLEDMAAYVLDPLKSKPDFDADLLGEIENEAEFGIYPETTAHSLRATLITRRIFLLKGGSFGLGPTAMEKGDLCFVIPNAQTPVIIRRGEGGYKLVGDCFVHDLVKAGATDVLNDSKFSIEPLILI